MIDLHCHILPGLDDGAGDVETALAMARRQVADGVRVVACTSHIFPGLYPNTGNGIRAAVNALQIALDMEGIALRVVPGADNHMIGNFVSELRAGNLLTLADSRYALVEPPHNVAPPRLEEFFAEILRSGFVPILTHPERLQWIDAQYPLIKRLASIGVLMQITAGALAGAFGRTARYWAERMLSEGCAHILATDAHDMRHRAPDLARGFDLAAERVGQEEARHLVLTRPAAVLANVSPTEMPPLAARSAVAGDTV